MVKNRILIAALFLLLALPLVAQSPTRFAAIRVDSTSDLRGAIQNGTGNVLVADQFDVDVSAGTDEINVTAGLVTFPGNVTVSGTCTGCGGVTFPLLGPADSVGAPNYSFSGDGDTGMYHPAANTVAFASQGINRLSLSNTNIDFPSSLTVAFTGPVATSVSTTARAGLMVPHGTAPTTPTDGDLWTTTAGLFARINGVTQGPYGTGAAPTTGSFTITWDDACTTSPTTAVTWQADANNVIWKLAPTSAGCTSDSANYATTTAIVPVAIRPAANATIVVGLANDTGVNTLGCLWINSAGTISAYKDGVAGCAGASWLNSGGTKSWGFSNGRTSSLSYHL